MNACESLSFEYYIEGEESHDKRESVNAPEGEFIEGFWGADLSLCRGLVLCAPRKIGARAFQWLSSVPCSCAGAGRSNAAFWNKCRSRVSMESSGDMSHQRVCCGGLSSPAVTSLRCARPARDEDVQVILVGFQGDGDERSGHLSHPPTQASSRVRGRTGRLRLGGE